MHDSIQLPLPPRFHILRPQLRLQHRQPQFDHHRSGLHQQSAAHCGLLADLRRSAVFICRKPPPAPPPATCPSHLAQLDANQPIDNYWIRANPDHGTVNFTGGINSAILRYSGAEPVEPNVTVAPPLVNELREQDLTPFTPMPVVRPSPHHDSGFRRPDRSPCSPARNSPVASTSPSASPSNS